MEINELTLAEQFLLEEIRFPVLKSYNEENNMRQHYALKLLRKERDKRLNIKLYPDTSLEVFDEQEFEDLENGIDIIIDHLCGCEICSKEQESKGE